MSTVRASAPARPARGRPPRVATTALAAAALFGAAAIAWGLVASPLRTWQAIHVNFLYWLGLTFAAILISVLFELTNATWGHRVKRLAEAAVALVPMLLVAYVGVAAGHSAVFGAAHREVERHGPELAAAKVFWLEPTFLLARDGAALLLLAALSAGFVVHALRPALGVALAAGAPARRSALARWIASGYRGYGAELARSKRLRAILAPIVAVAYAVVLTLFAVDQIAALDPSWNSTLFGAYFFITSLFMAWAALSVAAVAVQRRPGDDALARAGRRITVDDLHNLGKLVFAFCMLAADFFWSQFVVVWYGNIPEETAFVIRRIRFEPWSTVAWAVLMLLYLVPFVLLLFKRMKRNATMLSTIAGLVLVMAWLERFLLVSPSIFSDAASLPLGPIELAVTLGFAGAAGLVYGPVAVLFAGAPPETDLDERGRPRDQAKAEPEREEESEEEPEAEGEDPTEQEGGDV